MNVFEAFYIFSLKNGLFSGSKRLKTFKNIQERSKRIFKNVEKVQKGSTMFETEVQNGGSKQRFKTESKKGSIDAEALVVIGTMMPPLRGRCPMTPPPWAYGTHFHRGSTRFPLPLYALRRPPPGRPVGRLRGGRPFGRPPTLNSL